MQLAVLLALLQLKASAQLFVSTLPLVNDEPLAVFQNAALAVAARHFLRPTPQFYALDLPQAALTAAVFLPRVEALFPSTSIALLSHRPLYITIIAAIAASAVRRNSSATPTTVP